VTSYSRPPLARHNRGYKERDDSLKAPICYQVPPSVSAGPFTSTQSITIQRTLTRPVATLTLHGVSLDIAMFRFYFTAATNKCKPCRPTCSARLDQRPTLRSLGQVFVTSNYECVGKLGLVWVLSPPRLWLHCPVMQVT